MFWIENNSPKGAYREHPSMRTYNSERLVLELQVSLQLNQPNMPLENE
jgi:hypothetical protein